MLSNYLEKMLELYKHTDAVLITDRNGFIEYSTMISSDIKNFKNAEVTGKHILEIYTSLTEETSTIMRVLRDGKPIIDEKQKVINAGKNSPVIGGSHLTAWDQPRNIKWRQALRQESKKY